MTVANWKTQVFNVLQSLLYNNPNRVVGYQVRDGEGNLCERSEQPAPVRRLYETETPPERMCLETIQFVHHVLIPPGGRHVEELHVHPDAEELVVITRGTGTAVIGDETHEVSAEDVLHIPSGVEHVVKNDRGSELLGALFINVPTGEGLQKLLDVQAGK